MSVILGVRREDHLLLWYFCVLQEDKVELIVSQSFLSIVSLFASSLALIKPWDNNWTSKTTFVSGFKGATTLRCHKVSQTFEQLKDLQT